MSVRAKFKVERKELQRDGDGGSVYLNPVISGSEENKQFYQLTPGGQILLSTINPEAYNQFEVGKEFYIDFTPAE